jgi:hypothetical protein
MTTIVYRDGMLSADTAVFDRGTYCGQGRKIAKAADGTIGGGAGAWGDVAALLNWLDSGAEGSPPTIANDADSEYLWVRPNGDVWWAGSGSLPTLMNVPWAVAGSGFRIAMGALAHGATAEEAVLICADLDNLTRGPVDVLRLGAK